jgi:hypothetical protein
MNNTEMQEIIAHVEAAVKSTLKKSMQMDDLASRMGMIHFRLSLLPESKATDTLMCRTTKLTEEYYEKAVELRCLCQDLKEHLKKLKKDNQIKSGGSATARTGE